MQIPEALPAHEDVLLTAENPWPGLVSFSETNQAYFFGRDQEIADLARMVTQETLTVLFGKSGLGKSSLLKAGLAPVLRKNEFVPIYVRLDHSEHALPLADQIKVRIEETLDSEGIDAPRPSRAETLWEYFHTRGRDWWDRDNRLVKPILICDQFEELLTIGQDTPAGAARTGVFLAELEDLIDNRIPQELQKRLEAERGLGKNYDFDHVAYRVVLALREDFLADLESLHERLRPVMRNRFRLLPMNGGQAMDVILKPAARLVDEDVAVRIVNFVSASERSRSRQALTRDDICGRQVEPALLSVVLRELNNRRRNSGRGKITADLVGEGQAAEILQDFYDRGLSDMDERVGEFIVECLLTSSGARNRIAEEDALAKPGISPQVVATLIDRRIIQRQSSGGVKWLELSHDTLADVVRANRAEHRRRREIAAAAARAAEAHRHLMRSRRLVAAFASLAALAGIGFVYAYRTNVRLVNQQKQLERTNQQLEKQGDALRQAKQRTDEKDSKLRKDAEEQADSIVDSFRQELAAPKPDAGGRVMAELDRLSDSASHFSSVEDRYAFAAALGAEILYSFGYIRQGIAAAQKAAQLAEAFPAAGPPSEERQVIRAAVSYALGRAEMEEGHLSQAEGRLRAAVGLADSVPSSAKTIRNDAARIRALAQMAIGDVNLYRYSMKEARDAYQQLLVSLNRDSESSDAVLVYSKARTLQQLANNEEQYPQAKVNFDKAEAIVREMMDHHPDNLRWRIQFAELAYRYAAKMTDSGRSSEAARLLREVEPIAENTHHTLDPKNLRSAYVLAWVDLGLGKFYETSGNNDKAAALLRKVIDQLKEINDAQPSWLANRYSTGVSHYFMGEVTGNKDQEHKDKQQKEYVECRRILEALAADAPAYADYVRSAALANIRLGTLRSEAKDYEGALGRYQRAAALIERIPERIRMGFYFQSVIAELRMDAGLSGYLPLKRREDARLAYQDAIRIFRAAIGASPTSDTYNSLAVAWRGLGDCYLQEGAYGRVKDAYKESIAAYDEGLARFSKNPDLLGPLVVQKANTEFYFAQQWRIKRQLNEAAADLRAAVETAREGLKADLLQSELYGVLGKAVKEGAELKTLVSRSVKEEKGTGAESLQTLAKELDSTINTAKANKILWPEGAKASANNSILEVEQPQTWDIPPLIPGAWVPLSRAEQRDEMQRLAADGGSAEKVARDVVRIRKLPLTFYDNATLYEAEVRRAGKSPAVLNYVRTDRATLVLDGTSTSIHAFNREKASLQLETPQQASQYLLFFMAGLAGKDMSSTFRLIENPPDLPLPPTVTATAREKLGRIIVPMQVRQTTDGKWDAKATVRYSDALFYAILHVNNLDGNVAMATDEPVASDQPLLTEHYVGGLRVISDYIFQKRRLKDRAARLDKAKDWSGAVQAQGSLIKLVRENEMLTAADRAKELPGQLLALSWYQLHTKDFSGALTSTEEGLKLDPAKIELDTNRAHALLFLGRTKEAEDLYRKNVGKNTSQGSWEKVILEDLKTLEADGLSDPEFARIREAMGTQK